MSVIQYLGNNEFKISRKELERLLTSDLTLTALNIGGVDNWDYHYDSQKEYMEEYVENHDGVEVEDPRYPEISDAVRHEVKLIEGAVGE